MKRLIQLILLSLLVLLSGCQLNTSGPSRQDVNLPTVKGINFLADVSEIGFEWQPVTNSRVEGYNVYRYDEDNRQYRKIKTITTKYTSHFVDYDLYSNKVYKYKFSTYSQNGESSLTKDIVVKTEKIEKMPFVKTVLTLPKMIKIIWRPHPNARVYKYIIQRKETHQDHKAWKTIAEIRGRLNAEYIDTNLDTNRKYQYRVAAVTFNNVVSEFSDEITGKTKNIPQGVEGLNATLELPKAVILTWEYSKEKDITHYKVYKRSPGVKGYLSKYELIATTKKQSFTDENLASGEGAEYIVTAVNRFGMESKAQKQPVFGSTLGEIKTPKLVATKVAPGNITLRWSISDLRIKRYTLVKEFENYQGLDGHIFENLKNGIFIDKDVRKSVRYSYKLIAIDKNGVKAEPSEPLNLKVKIGVKY